MHSPHVDVLRATPERPGRQAEVLEVLDKCMAKVSTKC